ncbi:MAG: hypothetical protein KJO54_07120 [Gammaproteobacteria bacterium]|nr:hypothetical protein [Gammaproteobacteria bacterium]NNF61388.1 hypothetical protein [Gammaproteobacteria bacterium]
MTAQQWLFAGGIYTAGFAIFHLAFWRLFNWKEQLPKLSPINRAVMQVMNLTLTTVFILFAWISIAYADAMAGTDLGRVVTGGIAVVWALRAAQQLVFFNKSAASLSFFVLFVFGAALYTLPLL